MRTPLLLAMLAACALGAAAAGLAQKPDHFHHRSISEKVDYEALYRDAEPLETSQDGKQILAHCLAKYGGPEKLRKLEGFRLAYEMDSKFSAGKVRVDKSFARGRRHRVERNGERRILNGEDCWFQSPDQIMELDGGRYRAELFSYLTLTMPEGIGSERFDGVRFGVRPDDPLAYFYLLKADTLLMAIGIDPHDFYIRSSEGVIFQGEESYTFVNLFSDHRERDGYVFAHELVNISMGLEVGRSRLIDVEINPDFPEGEFRPR